MDPLTALMTGANVWYTPWDEAAFRALNLVGTNPVLDLIMVAATSLALPYVVGLLVVPLWWKGHRALAVDFLVVLIVAIVVTEALKYAFDRARPCDYGVLPNVNLLYPGACAAEGDPAFPSGHASRAFAAAAILSLRFGKRVQVPAIAFAVLVGVSRVYLGVHWPTDVLAGALVGWAVALLFVVGLVRWPLYRRTRDAIVRAVERILPRRARA